MIEFPRDPQNTIPSSHIKIIGLGGAGANILDRISLDGMEGVEMLALNADVRALNGSVAAERIQLGRNLTKGLGTGGDPDLGKKVTLEAEKEIRAAIKGRTIIFLCVGLGGGTGSGGAPIITRIAREEGAFVIVFATMPFTFEGMRRRDQAHAALNELAVLSNALLVFDNNRMGELVLAKQGIHEAFQAGDRLISDSIKAVIRLVIRPGLIHVGLDELMTALRNTRSRCLFGYGMANGKDRAVRALNNALASPLLDKGALLREAASVLVHVCGGQDMTLYEIELLMQKLTKQVPPKAHLLFGAAIDAKMNDILSITLISSLPEEKLLAETTSSITDDAPLLEPSIGFDFPEVVAVMPSPAPEMLEEQRITAEPEPFASFEREPDPEPEKVEPAKTSLSDWLRENHAPAEELPFAEPAEEEETADFTSLFSSPPAGSAAARDLREALLERSAEEAAPVTFPTKSERSTDVQDLLEKTRNKFAQKELLFEGGARGRFADTEPTVIDGDDLDIPPFLRKKKK
jgi:cell division protein FtsZ